MNHKKKEPTITRPLIFELASLFDSDFSADWLAEILDLPPSEVLDSLNNGVEIRMVRQTGSGFYCFISPTIRFRYQQRLHISRQEIFNKSIVNILIRDLPDGDTKTKTIASHLLSIHGGPTECEYLMKAGEAFLKTFNMDMARQCFGKILSNLQNSTFPEEDILIIRAAIQFSKSSTAGRKTSEVLNILEDAMERARRLDVPRYLSTLEMQMAKTKWLRSRYNSAFQHFMNGLKIAEALEDPKLLRSANNFRIISLFWNGRFKQVIETYEALVPEIDRFPNSGFPLLTALTVGRCYVHIGQVSHGLGMLDAINSFCREKGDRYLACHSQFTIGATMMDIRELDQASTLLSEAIAIAEKERNDWVLILGNLMLANVCYLKKEPRQTVQALQRFVDHRKRAEVIVQPYPYLLDLCLASRQGLLPLVTGLVLEEEMDRMLKGKNLFIRGIAFRFQAILMRDENRPTHEILDCLEKSASLLQESGHCIGLAKTEIEIARQFLSDGNPAMAAQHAEIASKLVENFSPSIIPPDLQPLVKGSSSKKSLLQEIFKLGQDLGTLRDTQILVHRIISTANGITGAERGAIFRLEKKGSQLTPVLIASRNLTAEQIERAGFADSREIITRVARTGTGFIQKATQTANMPIRDEKVIRSALCVPMILRNEVVGVLYLDNRLLKSSFENDDLELLSFFSGQAALALDNANAYQEIHNLNLKLRKETEYYQEENRQELRFDEIVGASDLILEVLHQTKLVAMTDTSVLIVGETGVGKELIARAIHQQSSRKNKPFIKVNTSALSKHLIPSELFGHEKGAFTGASQRRIGRFELANEGTLFLDEIGEISLDVQISLLRVLQTKEFERVGGDTTILSDFRLIAATNRNLLQEVKEGRFRSDLYFRINVFPIRVPPLRERWNDVEQLANHFLRIQAAKMGKVFYNITSEELQKLINYDWPGNIRELQNIIERGAILNQGPIFRVPELCNGSGKSTFPIDSEVSIPSLEQNERRHIIRVLQQCNWKVRGPGGAAEILQVNPSTLYFRIKKLGIQRTRK